MIPPFEQLIRDMDHLQKERSRWRFVDEAIRRKSKSTPEIMKANKEKLLIKQVHQWLQTNDLSVTREDKSKKLVILERQIYDGYIDEYIRLSEAEVLDRYPTSSLVKKWNRLLKNKNIPDFMKGKKISNPACPSLFAYAKTHKTPLTFRPIVEKCRSPLYNLEKATAA